jgi:hypothetical protein
MAAVVDAPPLGRRDQTIASLFGLWMVIGLFLDGWAHDNQKPESFFTPWHGVLYSGFAVAAAFALHRVQVRRQPGQHWRAAVPAGHGLTLVALGLFAGGAVGDLVWHETLGIEVGVEALLSPTHLVLLAAGLVALSAPVRAAWREPELAPGSLRAFLPVALSSTLLVALVSFFLLYLSPFSNDAAGTAFDRFQGQLHDHPSSDPDELKQLLGIASILMTSVLAAAPIAFLARRWYTPQGTFSLIIGLWIALLVGVAEFAQPSVIVVGIACGALADGLLLRRFALPVVCGATAALLWLGYFAAYAIEEGAVAWSAEVWSGSVFLATLLAAGVGFLAAPSPELRIARNRERSAVV